MLITSGKHAGGLSRRLFLSRAAVAGMTAWPISVAMSRPIRAAEDDDPEKDDPEKDDPEKSAARLMTPEIKQAVEKGLAFLADRQEAGGAFGSSDFGRDVAICALAGVSFLSSGSTPGRGPYGKHLDRCVDYLLANSESSGFIAIRGTRTHGPMYGHGFAAMFLAEVYGMSQRREIRDTLSKAIALIVNTQNNEGGWRYQPVRRDADISVTICQVMALRAARNAGLHVPKATIDRAIDYVKRCQNADGGFMYMSQGGPSDFPRSAAGVVALYSAGIYEGQELERGLKYLEQFKPGASAASDGHYFYAQYYAIQAMWLAGGQRWHRWYPAIGAELVKRQAPDGGWDDQEIGREYGTAMACIVLQIPNNLVPIFQR